MDGFFFLSRSETEDVRIGKENESIIRNILGEVFFLFFLSKHFDERRDSRKRLQKFDSSDFDEYCRTCAMRNDDTFATILMTEG